ncbi:hypothetical protein BGZ81_008817 [Podila clonocystis]|nr:hypothetical protein BGZ81_008817 [Podila clonocystis]
MDSSRSTPIHNRQSPAIQERERSVKVEPQRGPVKSIGEILNNEREGSSVSSVGESTPNPLAGLSKAEIAAIPVRPYLDQTVLPVLLEGMKQLAKERPSNPLEYLGHYLLNHSDTVGRSPGP